MTAAVVPAMKLFLTALDFVGTFVFALSGAVAAVKRELDFFGVLVLSFVAATTGGIIRDVLIGAIPPATLVDWRYLVISLSAGVLTFYWLRGSTACRARSSSSTPQALRCLPYPVRRRRWPTASMRRWPRCWAC